MNKEQYMKALKKKLRHLPKADFMRAVEYYEEYFTEAGPEQEEQAILDLGTPEEAADQIIQNLAIENTKKPVKNMKKGIGAVWVGILAICAAPVALPLFLVAACVVFILILAAGIVLVALMVSGIIVVVAGPVSILGGLTVLTKSIPAALICLGYGLLGIGLGLLLIYGTCLLGRKFLNWIVKLFGRMVKKGGEKDA